MFPQKIDSVIHQLHRVQRTPAVPGVSRSMGCLAEKLNREIVVSQARLILDLGFVSRMPVEGGVKAGKNPVPGHVNLSHNRLFSRASK